MRIEDVVIGSKLLFQQAQFSVRLNVTVVEIHETGRFFSVAPPAGHRFWCSAAQLSVPEPTVPADPDGFSPSERKLFDVVANHGSLRLSEIAAIVNGNPEQTDKWTAGVAGIVARRLEIRGKLKMVRAVGSKKSTRQFIVSKP